MRGELLRFPNNPDFWGDSHMVLPGGSDTSNGEGFEKTHCSISFSSPKRPVKKPAGSECLCNSGLGLSVLVCRKTKLVWEHAISLSETVARIGHGFDFGVTSVRSPASKPRSGP